MSEELMPVCPEGYDFRDIDIGCPHASCHKERRCKALTPPPASRDDAERLVVLKVAEQLWQDLQTDNLGGFSGVNRPFWIAHVINKQLATKRAEIATLKTDRDSWRRVCERLETELLRSAAPSNNLRAENERLRKWISAALEQFEKYPGRAVGMLRYVLNPTDPSRGDWDISTLASPQPDAAGAKCSICGNTKPVWGRRVDDARHPDGLIFCSAECARLSLIAQPNAGARGEADLIEGRMANERKTRDAVHSGNIDRDDAIRNSTSVDAPSPSPEAAAPIGETFGSAHDEIWAEYYSSEAAPPSADDMAQARELITRWNKVWQSGEDIDFSLQQEIAAVIRTARQAGVREERDRE